jgi:hypothetical protein
LNVSATATIARESVAAARADGARRSLANPHHVFATFCELNAPISANAAGNAPVHDTPAFAPGVQAERAERPHQVGDVVRADAGLVRTKLAPDPAKHARARRVANQRRRVQKHRRLTRRDGSRKRRRGRVRYMRFRVCPRRRYRRRYRRSSHIVVVL